MVDILISKTTAWETERGVEFLYDSERLLSMLEQYNILRQEKEQERQRQRDQKKLRGQLMVEMEALYGTKPSPSSSGKKGLKTTLTGAASDRKLSLGGAMLQTRKPEKAAPIRHPMKAESSNQKSSNSIRQPGGFEASSTEREIQSFLVIRLLSESPSLLSLLECCQRQTLRIYMKLVTRGHCGKHPRSHLWLVMKTEPLQRCQFLFPTLLLQQSQLLRRSKRHQHR